MFNWAKNLAGLPGNVVVQTFNGIKDAVVDIGTTGDGLHSKENLMGIGEEIAKYTLLKTGLGAIPFVGPLTQGLIDRAKDMKIGASIKNLKEVGDNLTFGLTQSKAEISKLNEAKDELQNQLSKTDQELRESLEKQKLELESQLLESNNQTKEELNKQLEDLNNLLNSSNDSMREQLKFQSESLIQLEQVLNSNYQELLQKQKDSENAIKILQDESLNQNSKLRRLEELANDEKIRLKVFDKRMNYFQSNLEDLQNRHNDLEKRIEVEKQERLLLQKELKETNLKLDSLQGEIKQTSLTSNKLLEYTKLMQKRDKTLAKLQVFEKKDLSSTKEIFDKWLLKDRNEGKSTETIKLMPLSKDSNWAKQYTSEELAEWGWEVKDVNQQGFSWHKIKIRELINNNLSDISMLQESIEYENLITQFTQDERLLLEICQDFGLEFPTEKPVINNNKNVVEIIREEPKVEIQQQKETETTENVVVPEERAIIQKGYFDKFQWYYTNIKSQINIPWYVLVILSVVIPFFIYLIVKKWLFSNNQSFSRSKSKKKKKVNNISKANVINKISLIFQLLHFCLTIFSFHYTNKRINLQENRILKLETDLKDYIQQELQQAIKSFDDKIEQNNKNIFAKIELEISKNKTQLEEMLNSSVQNNVGSNNIYQDKRESSNELILFKKEVNRIWNSIDESDCRHEKEITKLKRENRDSFLNSFHQEELNKIKRCGGNLAEYHVKQLGFKDIDDFVNHYKRDGLKN